MNVCWCGIILISAELLLLEDKRYFFLFYFTSEKMCLLTEFSNVKNKRKL